MPELPEVETIRRQLEGLITGSAIIDSWSFGTEKFEQAERAVGHRITSIDRRGKYLLARLDHPGNDHAVTRTGGPPGQRSGAKETETDAPVGQAPTTEDQKELVIHLGMTGRISVAGAVADFGSAPRPPHRRAEWLLEDGRVLEFTDIRRFGRIAVVTAGDHESLPTLHRMGPEPFDEEFTGRDLHAALMSSNQAMKTQLMSQRVVAGLGNIYVDESLWRARVHPESRRITRAEADRLLDAIRVSLGSGLANGGTTLRDYRDAAGGSGTNQLELVCYGRGGLPCTRCGRELQRLTLGGRTTTFCPHCQRRRL